MSQLRSYYLRRCAVLTYVMLERAMARTSDSGVTDPQTGAPQVASQASRRGSFVKV